MEDSEDNYLFQCPACRQHISDSQIHDHIQNCEFYYQHSSHSISYSSMHSSFDASYNYNRNSDTSSDIDSEDEPLPDFSARHKNMTPSKNHSIAICPVCFENFHNTRHSPLLLPSCGHTVCKPCLKGILDKSEYLTCPICRALNKGEIKHLPINYALLDLTDKYLPSKCQTHNLEYVAYCKDDDEVLCGACVFEHKAHSCCLLTDPSLNVLTDSKRKQMATDVNDLMSLKNTWMGQKQDLEKLVTRIKWSIEVHQSKIIETEKKIIEGIQEGSKFCLLELKEIGNSENIKKLGLDVKLKLNDLDKKLAIIAHKIEKFDELSMAEKLHNELEDKEKYKSVPDLKAIAKIHDKLGVRLDYLAAIQNQHLGL